MGEVGEAEEHGLQLGVQSTDLLLQDGDAVPQGLRLGLEVFHTGGFRSSFDRSDFIGLRTESELRTNGGSQELAHFLAEPFLLGAEGVPLSNELASLLVQGQELVQDISGLATLEEALADQVRVLADELDGEHEPIDPYVKR
jgi:hypothetical protein